MANVKKLSKRATRGYESNKATDRVDPRLAAQVGFWASVALTVLGIGYAAGLLAVMLVFQKAPFTTMEAYAADFNSTQEAVYTFVQVMAFLSAPLIPVWVAAMHQVVPEERRVLTLSGLAFALGFAVLACVNYYVQLVVVRQNIIAGNLQGLEWFLQWNGGSVMFALNMLAWFGFLGLAQLCIAPVFRGGRLEQWTRTLLIVTGVAELWGGVAVVLGQMVWVLPSLLLLTFGFPVVTVLTAIYFRRLVER